MNETKTTKRYVDDNLLGEGVLFRSCIGQRMGFSNTKISTYVNFGKDRLRIGVMPQRYQGRKEILYKDISSVTTKRYVNAYVIVLLVLFAIMSIFTAGYHADRCRCYFLGRIWKQVGDRYEGRLHRHYLQRRCSVPLPGFHHGFADSHGKRQPGK